MNGSIAEWWRGDEFPRFLADLLSDVILNLRPGRTIGVGPSALDALFGEAGLNLDSLERFTLATAVAEALQLSRIERPDQLREMDCLADWVLEARRCRANIRHRGGFGFRTSGSTGKPKFIVHQLEFLTQELEDFAGIFRGRKRILSVVPSHRMYGFVFTILLPLYLGIEVLDARAHSPSSVRAMVRPGDLLVAFPDYWRLCGDGAWPQGVDGVTAGSPCPGEVSSMLRAAGLNRLVSVYGSTETGGIAWQNDPEVPFRLLPHVMRDGPEQVLKRTHGAEYRIALPDRVAWYGPDLLMPVSRKDDAVQVGGINVYPEAIRGVLLAHPDVADAEVRMMQPVEGERLKAFIVAKDLMISRQNLRHDLELWVADRLKPLEQPRAFTFGNAVPTNVQGKRTNWDIE